MHPLNLGWKAVEGKLVVMQCDDMDVAPKALLKVVRCLTVRWDATFRAVPVAKLGWNVPLAVESVEASVLINIYENITEDNEYEEDT